MNIASTISYSYILKKAWPIILANAAVPLLGLVDTAVIGHFGSTTELAGLAVASLMFSFIYWGFGFLRMGTTGFVARKSGENNHRGVQLVVLQSFSLALLIALALLLTQVVIFHATMALLAPPTNVVPSVANYFNIRIWAAPATLVTYVMVGVFIGRGNSRAILLLQVFLNGLNAGLDILFAGVLGWGIQGIALGTCIAEYSTVVLGLAIFYRQFNWRSLFNSLKLNEMLRGYQKLLKQNGDIFIRTLFLLLSFSFFTHISGSFGETTLAANYVLLQLISFSAFFLDGFAHALESLVGKAIGARSSGQLKSAMRKSSVLAVITAALLALIILGAGEFIIQVLTSFSAVANISIHYLPLVALYVVIAVGAFQLDGLFIGAGYTSAMRNCSISSTLVLVVVWFTIFKPYGNTGLWWAFIVYVGVRAVTLGIYLPSLLVRSFAVVKEE
ncbi:MAG: MATE family multidrug resistance protein [Lentisphaeria bacterium]